MCFLKEVFIFATYMKNNSILHLILMGLVICSLFAPSILPILSADKDKVVAIDMNEEENKKETQKELDEKDIFFDVELHPVNSKVYLSSVLVTFYAEGESEHSNEILLPPPEYSC